MKLDFYLLSVSEKNICQVTNELVIEDTLSFNYFFRQENHPTRLQRVYIEEKAE